MLFIIDAEKALMNEMQALSGCVNRQISDAHDCGMGAEVRDKKYVDFAIDGIGRTNVSEDGIDVQCISKLRGCKALQRPRWHENV